MTRTMESVERQRTPIAPEAATRWEAGYGAIHHTTATRQRVAELARRLEAQGVRGDHVPLHELLAAADRLASAGMWLVVHETYARGVFLDGRPLRAEDFKRDPEGHTGGALNMVPAYVGYLTANAITGHTRGWLMGQGHCVAAIDSVNLLVGNLTQAHAARYAVTDEGLTRYVRDFYAYRLDDRGKQDSPLGSHVNAHTAGGLAEGGYLGFAELQYVHMPLRGERLVTFLSDGAFEEQRGSDWAPRWWRASDCGLVAPIMINNGRRIDQRTTMSQQGGAAWLVRHLRLNGFDPIVFDGRDPGAFAWAIIEIEHRLETAAAAVRAGTARYPVRLPYGIAVAPKGAGFYGAGTNLAHNLPLGANPRTDATAARRFNRGAARLHVPPDELEEARAAFAHHAGSGRPRERDNALANRDVELRPIPPPDFRPVPEDRRDPARWTAASPMSAIDRGFLAAVRANPHLRPRVGNPDEMRSNRMLETLEALEFRVTGPEAGVPESLDGAVITALNEEAVAAAALANKGGINAVVTYEAFGMKMHGVLRQEIVFAAHGREAGRPGRWLSVPLVLTSHTWENAKNEQSHQDPSLAEALMGEVLPESRVLFPADFNTAAAVIRRVFETRGQIWTLVVPKGSLPDLLTAEEAERLLREGGLRLDAFGHRVEEARLALVAVGGYQLREVVRASLRLTGRHVPHVVVYMLEPGRFRRPRTEAEKPWLARGPAGTGGATAALFPASAEALLFVTHTRPEPLLGLLHPLVEGRRARGLGYLNRGGTLSVEGLLFVNGCSWAHCVREAALLLGLPESELLDERERAALDGHLSAHGVVIPEATED